MSFQKITIALFGLFALLPLHAEQATTTETVTNDVDEETAAKLVEIADKCPVHKTLEHGAAVVTKLV